MNPGGKINHLTHKLAVADLMHKLAKDATLRIKQKNNGLHKYLVPKAGLEPARLSPLPPQDSVSTNSTTWAKTLTTKYY